MHQVSLNETDRHELGKLQTQLVQTLLNTLSLIKCGLALPVELAKLLPALIDVLKSKKKND